MHAKRWWQWKALSTSKQLYKTTRTAYLALHRISVAKNAYAQAYNGRFRDDSKCGGCVRGHTGLFFLFFSGHPIKKQQQLPRFESSASKLKKKLKKTCLTITFSLGQISSKKNGKGTCFLHRKLALGPSIFKGQGPTSICKIKRWSMRAHLPGVFVTD